MAVEPPQLSYPFHKDQYTGAQHPHSMKAIDGSMWYIE